VLVKSEFGGGGADWSQEGEGSLRLLPHRGGGRENRPEDGGETLEKNS